MIIIEFSGETFTLKERFSVALLKLIAGWIPDADFLTFESSEKVIEQIISNDHKVILSTYQLPVSLSSLLNKMGLIQIIIGKNERLVDSADIFIDPLEPKSDQFFFGTDYLPVSACESTLLEELSIFFGKELKGFLEELSTNRSLETLKDIVSIFKLLEWDSNFFGVNIGYISCRRLTPNIESYIKDKGKKMNIGMIQYNCNCHDQVSIQTAEKNGYSFVDVRITFEMALKNVPMINSSKKGINFRKANNDDIKLLKKDAGNIYPLSRYYFDTKFNRNKVKEFYEGWIEKAVLGDFDDYCFILESEKNPIAFCTIKEYKNGVATIGLVGVNKEYAGKAMGSYLLQKVVSQLLDKKFSKLQVVTQGRNYSAQRLYQRSGFITKEVELWYHKWLP